MNASDKIAARNAWSDYWQTGSTEQAMPDDNLGTQALAAFWDRYVDTLRIQPGGRLLDLACGGGFVSRRLVTGLAGDAERWQLLALDLAEPAVRQLTTVTRGALSGVVADAEQLPFMPGSFSAVVSQFGLEYAGHSALLGAASMLAPAGELVLLVHHAEGSIAQGCRHNAELIAGALNSGLLQGMRQIFGLLAKAGVSNGELSKAAEALQQPVYTIEALLKGSPACAAMPWVQRLYHDVRQLYERAAAYDPGEAMRWLSGMEGQLHSYGERMRGMVTAALSRAQLDEITQAWQRQGLTVQQADALEVEGRPLAWQLRAVRSVA